MKLTSFAAMIDPDRQILQKLLIILPPNKPFAQLYWVYTSHDCPKTSIQHLTSESGSVLRLRPDREQRLHAGALEQSNPIFPNVNEEQVAERHLSDAL
jgi:hypothetical protein